MGQIQRNFSLYSSVPVRQTTESYPELNDNDFLPYPFYFIIHTHRTQGVCERMDSLFVDNDYLNKVAEFTDVNCKRCARQ